MRRGSAPRWVAVEVAPPEPGRGGPVGAMTGGSPESESLSDVPEAPEAFPLPPWAWQLLEDYLVRRVAARGVGGGRRGLLEELARLWPELSCTVLVQAPWQGTIRFKRLARLRGEAMRPLLVGAEGYLRERFGGGKFKVNVHHGLHFVGTRNFKTEGPARWEHLPEVPE